MSRQLNGQLDQIMLSQQREPAYKIEIFDTRSSVGPDTINDIVRGLTLEAITGPRDWTSNVVDFNHTAVASDFAQTGVAVPQLTLTIADPGPGANSFDPIRNPTGLGRYLRRGNTIRLHLGDVRVDPDDWPTIFTGRLVGQAGVDINRTGGGRALITIKALGREIDFININLTTDDYGNGTSLREIALDIAGADMGLDQVEEIEWSNWGQQLNRHLSLQFVEIPPLVAIANLMMIDGLMPRFNGEGKLSETLGLVTQNPDRIYTNRRLIKSIVRPHSEVDPFNCVKVLGLAADQTQITQQLQALLEDIHITTGYFTNDEEFDIFFTEDRRQLATGLEFTIVKSANAGIVILGGTETFSAIDAPIGNGFIGGTITISTGYAGAAILAFGAIYLGLSLVPDAVLAFGGGVTQSIGRVIQAAALIVTLLLMTKIGKGQYAVAGEPFEFVYLELSGQAELPGLTTQTRKKLELMNQVLQSQSDVNAVARNTLARQQALGSMRQVVMIPDLKLTPDDVFELPPGFGPDFEQYQIQSITYTGKRSKSGEFSDFAVLTVSELTALGLE